MAKDLSLTVTLNAINKATGPLKQIMQGSQGVGRAMKDTRGELKAFNDQQKRIRAFRDMSRKSQETRSALREQRGELGRLTREIANTTDPSRRLVQQQEKAQKAADKLSSEYRQQRDRVRELSRNLPPAADGTRGLTRQQEALEHSIRETTERLNRQRDALSRLAKADVSGRFSTMTGEIGRLGRRALFAGGAAAAGIFGIANSTASLGDNVAKSADKMGISTDALQELRYAAERSGVSTQKLDSSTERFVKRLGEARQGGGAAAKAYEQLGLNASQLAELTPDAALSVVADRLAQVENHTDKVALAAQFFGREGVAMVNMLSSGSAGLEQLRADARATGYVLSDEAARDAEVFKDAMLDAELGMAGMKNTIGAELMPAITDLMRNLSSWMRENRDQVQAFAREFGERLKSAAPAILELGRGVAKFAVTLGELTTRAATAVGGFDNLAIILGTLFASKAILSAISFAVGVGKAIGALTAFANTLPIVATAVKALSAAFAATPIGWIVAGVAAVAYGGYLLWKNWGNLGEQFSGMLKQLKDAFNNGLGAVSRLLINWSPFNAIYGVFVNTLERLGISVPEQYKTLGGAIVDGLIGGILGAIQGAIDASVQLASSIGNWFKETLGIRSPSRVFEGFGINIVEGMINGISGMAGTLRDHVKGLASNIAGWMGDAVSNAVNVGRDLANGLGDGIKNGASSAWNAVRNLTRGTEDTARDDLDTHSPSRVFHRIGIDVVKGLGEGIGRNADGPIAQVRSLTDRLRNTAAGLMLGTAVASPALALQVEPPNIPKLPSILASIERPALPNLGTLEAPRIETPRLPELPSILASIDTSSLSEQLTVEAGAEPISFDTRPPLNAPSAQAGSGFSMGDINISVTPAQGMDERQLAQYVAQEVQRALANAQRDAQARQRSSLRDLD